MKGAEYFTGLPLLLMEVATTVNFMKYIWNRIAGCGKV
jgi:hypothetical protein